MEYNVSIKNATIKRSVLPVLLLILFFISADYANATEFSLPGVVEGEGTHFVVTNSAYLNVTLDSTETIKLRMESVPEMVTMMINPVTTAASTQITLIGFVPNTTYYKYDDNYHNLTAFTTDSSGSYSYAQDLSQTHFAFIQPRASTKFIKDDATGGNCTAIGIWDSSTKTCTLTQDVFETIQIDNDGITLDGNNHAVSGNRTGFGIYLQGQQVVTVKNLQIKTFSTGIALSDSNNNSIISNTVSFNESVGIIFSRSNNNNVTNNVVPNNFRGIIISGSGGSAADNSLLSNTVSNNTVGIIILNASRTFMSNNVMTGNQANFQFIGAIDADFDNSIDTTNLVDGKPIYYVKNAIGQTYDSSTNAGMFFCISCSGVTVRDLNLSKNAIGVMFYKTNNSKIENVNSHDNFYFGSVLHNSNGNQITGSTFSNNEINIYLIRSLDNAITRNEVVRGDTGIFVADSSDGNVISNNRIAFNDRTIGHGSYYGGIYISYDSDNNQAYNNNLIDNFPSQIQVQNAGGLFPVGNVFNLPAPTGGNYYSNFDTPTEGCNNANSDNFCDAPYVFTGGQDNLPWAIPIVAEKTLSEKAAGLAKLVVDAPYLGDGITFGGKGWDWNEGLYVTPDKIFTGYNYWDNKVRTIVTGGKGLDCSGLVQWSFNRSFDPSKSRLHNVIRVDSADAQYKKNSEGIVEPLQQGDLLFLDKNLDGTKDHVAMYVDDFLHNGITFDVVEAFSPQLGIRGVRKVDFELRPGFLVGQSLRRVVVSPAIAGQFKLGSPVDLVVTDPDGLTITPTTAIQTDEEYLREIPGELYYTENVLGADGQPEDVVYWFEQKSGNYTAKVSPEADASPTETYSLEFISGNQTIILAHNVPISQIPTEGYGVAVGETGIVSTFIPVSIDIKPGSFPNSINLGSGGTVPVTIFGTATFNVSQIDPATITLANASVQFRGNGQPMASYQDVNSDSILDIVVHVITEALALTETDVQAELNGFLLDGRSIKGSDFIRIVP